MVKYLSISPLFLHLNISETKSHEQFSNQDRNINNSLKITEIESEKEKVIHNDHPMFPKIKNMYMPIKTSILNSPMKEKQQLLETKKVFTEQQTQGDGRPHEYIKDKNEISTAKNAVEKMNAPGNICSINQTQY